MRRVVLLIALATCALATSASGATAATRTFGTVGAGGVPAQSEFTTMASGGVATFRFVINWRSLEGNGTLANLSPLFWDWKRTDRLVERSARAGVELLPVLMTPAAARLEPPRGTERETWARVLEALAQRYGPEGIFWTLNPLLPKRPITTWQIWNEQNSPTYWRPTPDPRDYASLVMLSADVIRDVDPAARIVLGGMFGTPFGGRDRDWYAWVFLRRLLKVPNVRSSFDVVALHPYARTLEGLRWQVRKTRKTMRRAGAESVPIWITEIGWSTLPRREYPDIPVPANGEEGQARKLDRAFRFLVQRQQRWRLERVLWFSWRDADTVAKCNTWCEVMGLFRRDGTARPAWERFTGYANGS